MDWISMVDKLGTFAVSSGLLAWLAKSITTHRMTVAIEREKSALKADYDAQIETLKADLRVQAEREIEGLKAELRVSAFTREIRFARLQERRMTVISELYANLVLAELELGSLMKPFQHVGEQTEAEKQAAAAKAANWFNEHYRKHRIFLSDDVCTAIDALSEQHFLAWTEFTTWHPEWVKADPSLAIDALRARQKAWQVLQTEVPKIRNVIEQEMRLLLGVLDKA